MSDKDLSDITVAQWDMAGIDVRCYISSAWALGIYAALMSSNAQIATNTLRLIAVRDI